MPIPLEILVGERVQGWSTCPARAVLYTINHFITGSTQVSSREQGCPAQSQLRIQVNIYPYDLHQLSIYISDLLPYSQHFKTFCLVPYISCASPAFQAARENKHMLQWEYVSLKMQVAVGYSLTIQSSDIFLVES